MVDKMVQALASSTDRLQLGHLFDIDLEVDPSRNPYVSSEHREGVFITNSTGRMRGEKFAGRIKLSFFAKDCAYLLVQAGVEPSPGQHLCKENDGGIIEMDDGARIVVDTKGYACVELTQLTRENGGLP